MKIQIMHFRSGSWEFFFKMRELSHVITSYRKISLYIFTLHIKKFGTKFYRF
jgi:hypothetical protein